MRIDEAASRQVGQGFSWGEFLAGFVPGLLQHRLGLKRQAVVAAGSCLVVFLAGWVLVRDRLFHFTLLAPERDTVLAAVFRFVPVNLLPEMLNLPAAAIGSTLAFTPGYEAERLWRLPRPGEDLPVWLTAASGMLAAFWAAAGRFQLRLRRDGGEAPPRPVCDPGLAAGLSWLVPGLGHWRAGQRDKGVVMGLAVVAVFALGMVFSHGHAVDRAIAPVWWIGQHLFGGGSLFAALVTAPRPMTAFPSELGLGTVLCTVAGLMNLVVMIDAFTICERSVFPLARHGRDAAAGAVAAAGTAEARP